MKVCTAVLLLGLLLALPAAAGPRPVLRAATWADARHAWAPCRGDAILCATEDGGRSWRRIFRGGNYIFTALRTSAGAGVVQTGNWWAYSFWTRDNGRRWYELPVVPTARHTEGDRAIAFAGRGSYLFWHQNARVLHRIAPWPPPSNPVCRAASWPGPNACVLASSSAPFTSSPVATIGEGALSAMRAVAGGVAALVVRADANASPNGVLIHRAGAATEVFELPEPPLPRRSLSVVGFHARWPSLILDTAAYQPGPVFRPLETLPRVLWVSHDGGRTWRVAATERVNLRAGAAQVGAPGAKTTVPGGWIASVRGAPARLVVSRYGRLRRITLPTPGCAVSAATPVVAWPAILVEARMPGRATAAHWWSTDGGGTWAFFGEC